MQVTARMQTPRRKWPLPEILGERELRRILDSLPNPRDRLLVSLLAGCGLRVSEACRIRWADFNRQAATLQINDPSGLRTRTVAVPAGIQPLFQGLAVVSRSSDPMVSGRRAGVTPRPLGTRQAERIVRAAGQRAGVFKIVTPGNLRHTYAVRRLMAGENIRVVQETLGHRSVKTTLRYQACILPKVASPADPPPSHPTLDRLAATIEGLKAAFARMQTPAKPCGP
jgi:integrase/recombinase XerD